MIDGGPHVVILGAGFGGLSAAHVEEIVGAIDSWRLVGPIDDPNFYGQILVVLVPLAWDRLVHEPRRWLRPVAGAALVGCVMAIGFTYSRGALAALVVMLLAYVALHASVLLRRPATIESGSRSHPSKRCPTRHDRASRDRSRP